MLIGDASMGFSVGGCVLDGLSAVPAFAYSLRLLRAGYKGKCINLRRSSDNTSTDIGFQSGVLNRAAALAFIGAGNGFITKWYNQGSSGSTGDLSQTTASSQPQIVSLTSGTFAALKFGDAGSNVINSLGNASYAAFAAGAITVNLVQNIISAAGFPNYVTNNAASGACGFAPGGTTSTPPIYLVKVALANIPFNSSNQPLGVPAILTLQSALGISSNYINANLFINGSNFGSKSLGPFGTQGSGFALGGAIASTSGYYVSEMIMASSSLSTSDRSTIEHSQEAYYNISGI